MKKMAFYAIGALSIAIFSGCAGIISGKSQLLTIKSEPEDAEVFLNGVPIGKTPLTYDAKKGKNQILTVKKDGYKQVDMPLGTSFDAAAAIGVLTYSLPLTTDISQGSAYEFTPNYYNFDLRKKDDK